MNENKPLICVQIPTYNQAKYLPSLFEGLLASNYSNLYLHISNDASTDESDKVINSYLEKLGNKFPKVLYENHLHNLGGQGRGNMEYLYSQLPECDYVHILEGDDFWHVPDKLDKQLALMSDTIGAVHTDVKSVHENGQFVDGFWKRYRINQTNGLDPDIPQGNITNYLYRCNFIYTCTLLVKRDLYLKAFDFKLLSKLGIILGDYAGCLRLSKLTNIMYVDEPLATYRVISTSTSHLNRPAIIQDTGRLQQLAVSGILFQDL